MYLELLNLYLHRARAINIGLDTVEALLTTKFKNSREQRFQITQDCAREHQSLIIYLEKEVV